MQAGSGAAWFLVDASRAIRPIVWQTRIPYEFVALTEPYSDEVFLRGEFLYGVRARANAGYGLWQRAFGSKATLDTDSYEAARAAMQSVTGDYDKKLNIQPTHLVCGTALEGAARRLIMNDTYFRGDVPVSNEWAGSVELIVTSYLD